MIIKKGKVTIKISMSPLVADIGIFVKSNLCLFIHWKNVPEK